MLVSGIQVACPSPISISLSVLATHFFLLATHLFFSVPLFFPVFPIFLALFPLRFCSLLLSGSILPFGAFFLSGFATRLFLLTCLCAFLFLFVLAVLACVLLSVCLLLPTLVRLPLLPLTLFSFTFLFRPVLLLPSLLPSPPLFFLLPPRLLSLLPLLSPHLFPWLLPRCFPER